MTSLHKAMRQSLGMARRQFTPRDRGRRTWVYGRRQLGCLRCGTPIVCRRQGDMNRSTYYCPQCQEVPSPNKPVTTNALPDSASPTHHNPKDNQDKHELHSS